MVPAPGDTRDQSLSSFVWDEEVSISSVFFGAVVTTGGVEVELTAPPPCPPPSAQCYFCWVPTPTHGLMPSVCGCPHRYEGCSENMQPWMPLFFLLHGRVLSRRPLSLVFLPRRPLSRPHLQLPTGMLLRHPVPQTQPCPNSALFPLTSLSLGRLAPSSQSQKPGSQSRFLPPP